MIEGVFDSVQVMRGPTIQRTISRASLAPSTQKLKTTILAFRPSDTRGGPTAATSPSSSFSLPPALASAHAADAAAGAVTSQMPRVRRSEPYRQGREEGRGGGRVGATEQRKVQMA